MRGNPWIRIVLVALGVLLMGWPVWRLTRAEAPAATAAVPQSVVAASFNVTIFFAHAPSSFAVTNLGQPIVAGTGPATEFHAAWAAQISAEGTDLLLKAQWPAATPRTAVEIKVESSNGVLTDQTFWGTGTLTELVTVKPAQP